MSDNVRKDFSAKAKEAATPESEKTTFEKVKETVTDAVDSVAQKFQEQTGDKGFLQKAGDNISDAVSEDKKKVDSHIEKDFK